MSDVFLKIFVVRLEEKCIKFCMYMENTRERFQNTMNLLLKVVVQLIACDDKSMTRKI